MMKVYTKIMDKFDAPGAADTYRESSAKPGRAEYLDPKSGLWVLSTLYRRRDLRNPAMFTRQSKH